MSNSQLPANARTNWWPFAWIFQSSSGNDIVRNDIGTAWAIATARRRAPGSGVLDDGTIDVAPRSTPHRGRWVSRLGWSLFAAIIFVMAVVSPGVGGPLDRGVWLIDGRAAVEISHCNGLLCGRIVWLRVSENPGKRVVRDEHNPDPLMRQRKLCGLTIFWDLHAAPQNRWVGGWFYNPDDGSTYRVSAKLSASDVLFARIYLGTPLFGRTKLLRRIAYGTSKGWC